MNQQRIDEIRARCDRATPGPWYNGDGSVDRFFAGKNTVATNERVIVERATYNDEFDRQTYADIEFIAASRTDIPDLLDEVDRLTAELAAAQREIDGLTDAYDLKMRVHDALNRDYVELREVHTTLNGIMCGIRDERDEWKARAEAAENHHAIIAALPNCNDCKDMKSCDRKPVWGKWVRFNCPLWRGPAEGGEDKP